MNRSAWRVGFGADVPNAKFCTGGLERFGNVTRSVIRHFGIARYPVVGSVELAELLDVEMDQVARPVEACAP